MSPASERVKRHRQRRRTGLTRLSVDVDLGAVAEFLIDRGFLEAWDDRDRDAVGVTQTHPKTDPDPFVDFIGFF